MNDYEMTVNALNGAIMDLNAAGYNAEGLKAVLTVVSGLSKFVNWVSVDECLPEPNERVAVLIEANGNKTMMLASGWTLKREGDEVSCCGFHALAWNMLPKI